MKTQIWITTQFEGVHCWKNAPDRLDFLRCCHRHMFHVKVVFSVTHYDRDLEFFDMKELVNGIIAERLPRKLLLGSCEQIALIILEALESKNVVSVEVSEDGENGAIVCA